MTTLSLNLQSVIDLTYDQFYQLCQNNNNLRFERTATGELIILPPVGGETSNRNGKLTQQLFNWTDGCIALSNADMDVVWNSVSYGTPILIEP